jgi:hypothetical protein
MAALSERKLKIVRTLVESAPDRIVGGLQKALAETGADTVLAAVRRLVDEEARDRHLRNTVLQPIAPLCVGDGSSTPGLVFPLRALVFVWRGLNALAPDEVALAKRVPAEPEPDDTSPLVFDVLTGLAAAAIRRGDQRDFRAAADVCERARSGGAERFAACLDLAPVVRQASARHHAWISHGGEDTAAAARLAYKDAVAIAEDAGPRFFEMLGAQLAHPWMVLRIISAVMDKPTERYLRDSELAVFAERIMDDVDEALSAIARLDIDGGPEAGRAAGRHIEFITQRIGELEIYIELTRERGWGHHIVGQKKTLASVVEARLLQAEKLGAAALPSQAASLARLRKSGPKLTDPPDPKVVNRALTLLNFSQEIRASADYAGFSAPNRKMLERMSGMLDHYVEDVLDAVRGGEVENVEIAHAYLLVAADFSRLLRDRKAAEIIRRRAASACHGESSANTELKGG